MADDIDFNFDDKSIAKRLNGVKSKLREQTAKLEETLGTPVAQPEIDTTRGDFKHLQIRVPTAGELEGTIITAGRRQEDRSYNGLGVATNRHVVVNARGGKAESTMGLQANGQVLIQSDNDSLYAVSKGPTIITSSSAVDVTGAGGVFIAGGLKATVVNPKVTGEAPVAPEALKGLPDFTTAAANAWKSTDTLLKDQTQALDKLQDKLDPSYATTYKPAHDAIGLEALAKQALKDNNVPGQAQDKEGGAVVIHGDGGLLYDTPKNAVTRAGKALVLSSDQTALLGQTQVDVYGASAFSITAGDQGRVYAGTQLRLVAHDDKVHIGARKGEPVQVQAKEVHLGETSPEAPQVPTDAISLRALKHVSVTTDKDASRGLKDAGIHLQSHDVIEGKSDKTITLEAKDKLTVQTADKQIKIVVDSAGSVLVKAKSATVTVSDSDGVKVKHKQAEIEAATSTVTVKVGGSNKVEVSAAGVTVKGSLISIG